MPVIVIVLGLILLCLIYIFAIRPWILTWGATQDEIRRSLPGDDLVKKPHFIATRAVTIQAPPPEVWKWIIQIGLLAPAGTVWIGSTTPAYRAQESYCLNSKKSSRIISSHSRQTRKTGCG